jgi:hypothetical protein
MNANSRLHRDRLANCLLPCSSWQTASRYHPYLSSSHSQCCRMELSKISGVDTLPCGSDAHHVGPSQRATAFIFEAQLLLYRLERAWYRNDAQSGRDLHLASSLPELVSPFDLPRWLLPPASRTVSHRGKPPPRCAPHHPMQRYLPQSPRTRMHQPLQIFISPLSLGGPIVDEDFSPSSTQ